MLMYLLKRLLYVLPVAFGVSIICFLLVHIAPGDPLSAVLPPDASAQLQEEMRRVYGFDRALPIQFGLWLMKALHGDLGRSIATGRPVLDEVGKAAGNTMGIAMLATIIGFPFGCPFGIVAGHLPGPWLARAASALRGLGGWGPLYVLRVGCG